MSRRFDDLDELAVTTIRTLSMDGVQKANSGHPGMPMGMADIAEVLWNDFMQHNPANPNWPDRDRFVLSNGHGSMLIYSLLHLTGYDLPIEELGGDAQDAVWFEGFAGFGGNMVKHEDCATPGRERGGDRSRLLLAARRAWHPGPARRAFDRRGSPSSQGVRVASLRW